MKPTKFSKGSRPTSRCLHKPAAAVPVTVCDGYLESVELHTRIPVLNLELRTVPQSSSEYSLYPILLLVSRIAMLFESNVGMELLLIRVMGLSTDGDGRAPMRQL